jgi:hypothetical protein
LFPLESETEFHGEANVLRLWLPRDPTSVQSSQHCINSEEFDLIMSHRHNQRFLHRCIYRSLTKDINQEVFDSFETFIDPFFASSQIIIPGNSRDLRRLFSNLTRSINSLEMGQVYSFSSGS